MPHDVSERRRTSHQVVLVGAVRGALVVGVVLVQIDRLGAGDPRGLFTGDGKATVYRLVHNRELPAVRVGRSFRVHAKAVHDMLETSYFDAG